MRALLAALIFCVCASLATSPAQARYRLHHHHHHHHDHAGPIARGAGGRPSAWCGWYMRQLLGIADRSFNLAANWAHWGRSAGGPRVGVVVVWPHHVGRIVGGQDTSGRWLVNSGNDGHAVRTRYRSLAGAIAFRI